MSFPRATSVYLPIEIFDPSDPTVAQTGLTFSSGDTKIAKDGGSLANTTNNPVEVSEGLYWLQLTATEMDAATLIVIFSKVGSARSSITVGTHGMPSGIIATSGSNTATTFKTTRAEGTDDYWKDSLFLFTTGALAGQIKKVSAYTSATSFITVSSAFTTTPTSGDNFILVDR